MLSSDKLQWHAPQVWPRPLVIAVEFIWPCLLFQGAESDWQCAQHHYTTVPLRPQSKSTWCLSTTHCFPKRPHTISHWRDRQPNNSYKVLSRWSTQNVEQCVREARAGATCSATVFRCRKISEATTETHPTSSKNLLSWKMHEGLSLLAIASPCKSAPTTSALHGFLKVVKLGSGDAYGTPLLR